MGAYLAMTHSRPALVVLSTLFPSREEPVAGVFIRERMFRVAKQLPVTVVSPQPWFPLSGLIRRWKPNYRPERASFERVDGIEIHRPRFIALPGVLRRLDGFAIAVACRALIRRLQHEQRADVLDVHFGYPDGYAGALLARWLRLPFTVTLRGKEARLREANALRRRMEVAARTASRTISVSAALRDVAVGLGADPDRSILIGNGIDLAKFRPVEKSAARKALGVPDDATVLVSVGWLVERKGFHRVIEAMPELVAAHPKLLLLIVGGAGPEGDYTIELHAAVRAAAMERHVRFLGPMPPEQLHVPLSAADLFVLATRYEGWANVFLEAMACGLPVVTTRVGGNAEVVCSGDLGVLVPFGDRSALVAAIDAALRRPWDRQAILDHAADNTWDRRIERLVATFQDVYAGTRPAAEP